MYGNNAVKKCVKSGRVKWFVTILYYFLIERHTCTHWPFYFLVEWPWPYHLITLNLVLHVKMKKTMLISQEFIETDYMKLLCKVYLFNCLEAR